VLLAFASFFSDVATEMLYPVLPVFLTQTLHASGSVVGLVEGVAQATQNIVQGFSGWLSDKLQRRKPIALVGYFLAALAKPLMGLSTAWEGVLGARFLDRFATGTRSAPRDALVASSVEAQHRGKAFGLEGIGDNAGAFVGPLIAVALISFLLLDLRVIFYLAAIPAFLAGLMVLLVHERRAPVEAKTKLDVGLGRFSKTYWRYLAATAVFGLGNSSNSFLILETQGIGASLTTTILIYAGFNLVAALVSYPAGYLSDVFGRRGILVGASIVFVVVYIGFALSSSIALIGVLFVLYGAFSGVFRAVGKAMATDFVSAELRASGLGWYSATIGLSGLAASIIAGLLWDNVGHAAVFIYGAAFAVVGTALLVVLVPSRKAR